MRILSTEVLKPQPDGPRCKLLAAILKARLLLLIKSAGEAAGKLNSILPAVKCRKEQN
jgi:hypothetical protein